MKWIKKYKDEIINGVQFFTMLYTMTMGFWFTLNIEIYQNLRSK